MASLARGGATSRQAHGAVFVVTLAAAIAGSAVARRLAVKSTRESRSDVDRAA
jgi:hypothetical protein